MHPTSTTFNPERQASHLFHKSPSVVLSSLILATTVSVQAQKRTPRPLPSPTPNEQDEPVKVFTEEVRLPVIAVDQFGHYDPTVVPEDILVLEDGVAQQIKSVRRIPANVLLVLDTGGELSGLGGMSKRTNLTRDVAIELLNRLREDTWVEVMQFNNSVELLQNWTRDRPATLKVLKTKVSSGKRARFSDAIVATAHIISYTEFVRQEKPKDKQSDKIRQVPPSHDPITANDPTQPPGTTRNPAYVLHSITFDPAMTRRRKAYEADIRKSQETLTNMAEETGGQIFLPKTGDEMISQAREAAREVGAEYVVTYRPKRPLASANKGGYRRIEVASRRVGLSLRSRRGYVVPAQP